jgi:hypothetical protein
MFDTDAEYDARRSAWWALKADALRELVAEHFGVAILKARPPRPPIRLVTECAWGAEYCEVLVVDVNERLLDLRSFREPFARAFGATTSLSEWFARLLHGSLVATVMDAGYACFPESDPVLSPKHAF